MRDRETRHGARGTGQVLRALVGPDLSGRFWLDRSPGKRSAPGAPGRRPPGCAFGLPGLLAATSRRGQRSRPEAAPTVHPNVGATSRRDCRVARHRHGRGTAAECSQKRIADHRVLQRSAVRSGTRRTQRGAENAKKAEKRDRSERLLSAFSADLSVLCVELLGTACLRDRSPLVATQGRSYRVTGSRTAPRTGRRHRGSRR